MKRIPTLTVDVVTEKHLKLKLSKAKLWLMDFDCTHGACKGEGCPVNIGNEQTDLISNYGCLPEPIDIIKMRALDGLTWACHDDSSKPCISGIKLLKGLGLPYKVLTLRSEW